MKICNAFKLFVCGLVLSSVSCMPSQVESVLDFVWTGAVTDQSATIVTGVKGHRTLRESQQLTIKLFEHESMKTCVAEQKAKVASSTEGLARISFDGLKPDTAYFYAISVDGKLETKLNDSDNGTYAYTGRFKTFPKEGAPASFSFIHTCSTKGGSEGHPIFETIKKENPLFFLHTGDFFYIDQGDNHYENEDGFRDCFDKNLNCFDGVGAAHQASLYRTTPIVYMWDDHDFGKNDCVGTVDPGRTSKPFAHAVYREYVPHYELAGKNETPIYQAFTVGRVRFIMTDLRTDAEKPNDNQDSTRLGKQQKKWFKKQLLEANGKFPLIVWISTIPWNGEESVGHDRWQSYAKERREISNFIQENNITGLCALAGDMHATTIDDGTNTDFSDAGGAGFPLFHAGPVGTHTSIKGGPYSKGASDSPEQFGLVEIKDDGQKIRVTWTGRDAKNRLLKNVQDKEGYPSKGASIKYSFKVDAPTR